MIHIRCYFVWPGSFSNNGKGTSTLLQVLNENGQAMSQLNRVPIWLGKSNNSIWVGEPSYAPTHQVASWPDLFQTVPHKKAFLKLAQLVEDVRLDAEALKYYWFHKYHWYYSCHWDYIDCRRNQRRCRHLRSPLETTSALFGDLLKPLLGCVASAETLPWKNIFRLFPNHVTWVADIWWHLRSKNLFLSQVRPVPKQWEPGEALDSYKLLIWPVQAWLIWRESKIAQVDSPTDMIVEFQRKLV